MTFWQGLAITILAETTDVGGGQNNPEQWAASAQNFLICLEMLLFSIAHFHCFPTEEWEENYKALHSKAKFGDSMALGDFVSDLKLILRAQKKQKKKKQSPSEPTVPEGDEESSEVDGSSSVISGTNHDDNDDTDRTSIISDISTDGEQGLLSSVAKKIKEESDSLEVKEARERLLASGFLDDDINNRSGKLARDDEEEDEEDPELADASESSANERTGLLSGTPTSKKEEILRPSIFTTIAELSLQPSLESPTKDNRGKRNL